MPKDLHRPARARSSPRFFEPPSEPEFSWPPRAEDLEACAIVPLEGEHAGGVLPFVPPPVEVEPVFVELSAVLAPALPLAVEDAEAPASARSAWLAVLVAAACLVIAYTQFRIEWTRGGVPTVVLESAPEGESTPILEVAPEPPAPVALIPASRPRASDVRREPVQPALVAVDARAETDPMPSASLEAQPVATSLPAPLATRVAEAPALNEEDGIRTTLTR